MTGAYLYSVRIFNSLSHLLRVLPKVVPHGDHGNGLLRRRRLDRRRRHNNMHARERVPTLWEWCLLNESLEEVLVSSVLEGWDAEVVKLNFRDEALHWGNVVEGELVGVVGSLLRDDEGAVDLEGAGVYPADELADPEGDGADDEAEGR